jgi:peptidoglycan biosynthesis protein MviN/MurJ (putative lipid II flippase)
LAVDALSEIADFDATSTAKTTAALDGLAIGIPAVAVTIVFFRAMQAVVPRRSIGYVCAIAVAINAVLDTLGGVTLGLFGVSLGLSFAGYAVMQLQGAYLMHALRASWREDFFMTAAAPVGLAIACSTLIVALERGDLIDGRVRLTLFALLAALTTGAAARVATQPAAHS